MIQDEKIRVVVADDHHVVRTGIIYELGRQEDIDVVGEANDGEGAIQIVERVRPNVLVLDVNLGQMSGLEVAERLSAHTGLNILILSAFCDREYVSNLFAAGAKGYLLKDESPRRIVEGVRQVARGEPALSLDIQKLLLTRHEVRHHELSSRELEVLRLLARGYTNDEIAQELVIAIGTVKNHITNIYRRLPDVRTRAEAVVWAWENRIVWAD